LPGGEAARMVVSPSWDNAVVGYRSTNKTVCSAEYHIIWCPKYRRRVLAGRVEVRAGGDHLRGGSRSWRRGDRGGSDARSRPPACRSTARCCLVEVGAEIEGPLVSDAEGRAPVAAAATGAVVAVVVRLYGGRRCFGCRSPLRREPKAGGVDGSPLPGLPRPIAGSRAVSALLRRPVRVEPGSRTGELLPSGTADARVRRR